MYLHELKGSFKIFNRIHLDSEKLEPHDEANGALDHDWTLLFLPQLLQLSQKLLFHSRKPKKIEDSGVTLGKHSSVCGTSKNTIPSS